MTTRDTCCTIAPYFKIHAGQQDAFRSLCERLVEQTKDEPKCLFYGFSVDGDEVHCQEAYVDADGLLTHLERAGSMIEEALLMADMTRLEVHGPEKELEKLREPLAQFNPRYFMVELGFRR